MAHGQVQFVVTIPKNFSRKLARGETPQLLLEADATDPSATNNAIVAMQGLASTSLASDLAGPLANLTLGITFSSVARNQLQAMQMTFFYFLPSILLSGFMFPYRGMPEWAQWISSVLPLTHFLVLVRGIMLKGNELAELWPEIWPILAFMVAVILIGLRFYKRTLD